MSQSKERLKSHAGLNCHETIHHAYNGLTVLDRRANQSYPGTNRSNTLGPVQALPDSAKARMSKADRAKFWGERTRAVGGRNPGDSGPDSNAEEDDDDDGVDAEESEGEDDDNVIIAHHQLPGKVYANHFHSTWAKSIIDLTPGTGVQALVALKEGLGYLGLTHNEIQQNYIYMFLKEQVLLLMKDPESRFYNLSYAKLVSEEASKKKVVVKKDAEVAAGESDNLPEEDVDPDDFDEGEESEEEPLDDDPPVSDDGQGEPPKKRAKKTATPKKKALPKAKAATPKTAGGNSSGSGTGGPPSLASLIAGAKAKAKAKAKSAA